MAQLVKKKCTCMSDGDKGGTYTSEEGERVVRER